MKLEQQCVSLEIAKQLKELGVKQESLFYWATSEEESILCIVDGHKKIYYFSDDEYELERSNTIFDNSLISAFTVAELGEMLREEECELPTYLSSTKEWVAVYETTLIGGAKTEADARGKMLIYLLENNLISL